MNPPQECPICAMPAPIEWGITYQGKTYHYNCLMLNRRAIFAELVDKVENLAINLYERTELKDETKQFLETLVEKAWQDEEKFSELTSGKKPERTEAMCQGISRRIKHYIQNIAETHTIAQIKVEGKTHLIVLAKINGTRYILDGTIKQFHPEEEQRVFDFKEYYYPINDLTEWLK